APLVTSIIVTVRLLRVYKGWELIPGPVWFVAKVFVVLFALLWVRATWPRLRIDQIMGFAWKGLFGLALINILVTAVEVLLLQDADGVLTSGDLWLMAAINWGVTVISLIVMVNVLGQKRLKRPVATPSPLANMYAEAD
ncbi:MAG: NADH-quinone oxidoreductase subunit H, partial [Chloroflexi bacterium]|nr:NADH-quinone oxidoreductase subunit H [Chloroflexota bacterium]